MKLIPSIAAIVVLACVHDTAAFAGVGFGAPEFPNYLTRPWPWKDTCHWWTSAYIRACPGARAVIAVVPAAPLVKAPPIVRTRSK